MRVNLMRFNGDRLGLVIEGSHGKQIVDVLQSLERSSIARGRDVAGRLRVATGWSQILEEWQQLRPALRDLIDLARTPGERDLVMFPLDAVRSWQSESEGSIAALQISEPGDIAIDPTGRAIMGQQFEETSEVSEIREGIN